MKKIVIEVLVDGIYCGDCRMLVDDHQDSFCWAFGDHVGEEQRRCSRCLSAKHYECDRMVDIVGPGVYWGV